jgi:hypothetical protein
VTAKVQYVSGSHSPTDVAGLLLAGVLAAPSFMVQHDATTAMCDSCNSGEDVSANDKLLDSAGIEPSM